MPGIAGSAALSGSDCAALREPRLRASRLGLDSPIETPRGSVFSICFIFSCTSSETVREFAPISIITVSWAIMARAPLVWDHMASNLCVDFEAGDRAAVDTAFARADRVISAADPQTTFLKLVGVENLEIEFTNRIRRLRCEGYVADPGLFEREYMAGVRVLASK